MPVPVGLPVLDLDLDLDYMCELMVPYMYKSLLRNRL